jgi:hypothetical protein
MQCHRLTQSHNTYTNTYIQASGSFASVWVKAWEQAAEPSVHWLVCRTLRISPRSLEHACNNYFAQAYTCYTQKYGDSSYVRTCNACNIDHGMCSLIHAIHDSGAEVWNMLVLIACTVICMAHTWPKYMHDELSQQHFKLKSASRTKTMSLFTQSYTQTYSHTHSQAFKHTKKSSRQTTRTSTTLMCTHLTRTMCGLFYAFVFACFH